MSEYRIKNVYGYSAEAKHIHCEDFVHYDKEKLQGKSAYSEESKLILYGRRSEEIWGGVAAKKHPDLKPGLPEGWWEKEEKHQKTQQKARARRAENTAVVEKYTKNIRPTEVQFLKKYLRTTDIFSPKGKDLETISGPSGLKIHNGTIGHYSAYLVRVAKDEYLLGRLLAHPGNNSAADESRILSALVLEQGIKIWPSFFDWHDRARSYKNGMTYFGAAVQLWCLYQLRYAIFKYDTSKKYKEDILDIWDKAAKIYDQSVRRWNVTSDDCKLVLDSFENKQTRTDYVNILKVTDKLDR